MIRRTFPVQSIIWAAVAAVLCMCPDPASAQGNIFGTVQNADAGNPGVAELRWFGFLSGTDEEIRTESNTGAGYDGLNWFDDFQNYTTEAAGNPYDFVFRNIANGEMLRLSGTIPSNSFHQQDIQLAPALPVPQPSGLTAVAVSATTVRLSWDSQPGVTFHVYRRVASNNSVYRRIDDPTGNLLNPGVAGSEFDDNTSDGVSDYAYLLIAENASGQYSAHSDETVVSGTGPSCLCDCHGDPVCDGVTNVLDAVFISDIAFRGGTPVPDPNLACPNETTDVNCDGVTNIVDVATVTHVAFRGGNPTVLYCDPCAP